MAEAVDQSESFWKPCKDDEDADGGDEMEQSSQDMPTIEGEIPIGENPHESHDRDHPLGDSTIDSMDGSTVDEETNDSQNDNNHFGGNLAGYVPIFLNFSISVQWALILIYFFSLELSESDEEAPQESNIAAAFDGPNDLFGNISDLSDED